MAVRTFTAGEIAAVTGGRVLRDPAAPVAGLCLDSRTVKAGNLFAALPGAKADGHDLPRPGRRGRGRLRPRRSAVDVAEGCGVVLVASVEEALRALGTLVRSEFRGEVVGIVGSCGKTTTKDFTAAVLRRLGPVDATAGNRNNLLGAPGDPHGRRHGVPLLGPRAGHHPARGDGGPGAHRPPHGRRDDDHPARAHGVLPLPGGHPRREGPACSRARSPAPSARSTRTIRSCATCACPRAWSGSCTAPRRVRTCASKPPARRDPTGRPSASPWAVRAPRGSCPSPGPTTS